MRILSIEAQKQFIGRIFNELPNVHDGADGESAERPSFRRGGVGATVVDTSTQQWALHDRPTTRVSKSQAQDALSYPKTHGELA